VTVKSTVKIHCAACSRIHCRKKVQFWADFHNRIDRQNTRPAVNAEKRSGTTAPAARFCYRPEHSMPEAGYQYPASDSEDPRCAAAAIHRKRRTQGDVQCPARSAFPQTRHSQTLSVKPRLYVRQGSGCRFSKHQTRPTVTVPLKEKVAHRILERSDQLSDGSAGVTCNSSAAIEKLWWRALSSYARNALRWTEILI